MCGAMQVDLVACELKVRRYVGELSPGIRVCSGAL